MRLFFVLMCAAFPALCLAESPHPQTVGVIIPLSGAYANFGEAARIGLQMGLQAAGDSSIKVLYEDSQYDSAKALSAYRKLTADDGAQIILVLGSPPSSAVIPLAEKQGVSLFVWTSSPRLTRGRKNVVRLMASGAEQGAIMSSFAKAQGYSSVGYFLAQNEFAQSVSDGFRDSFGEDAISFREELVPSEMDFRMHLARARTSRVAAIGLCLNTNQLPAFFLQAQQLGVRLPFFGCHALSSPEVARALADNGQDAWFVEGTVSERFREDFTRRSPDTSGIWLGAAFHDVGLLLSDARLRGREIAKLVGACLDRSAFPKSCIVRRDDDAFLDVPLGVTRIRNGDFVRE